MYRKSDNVLEIFLVHPGGPFWTRKDEGAWTIPKGLIEEGEDTLPGVGRGGRVVVAPLVIEERMLGPGVDLQVVRDPGLIRRAAPGT